MAKQGQGKKAGDGIRPLIVRKNAKLREIYAQYRKEFSAADLQKYTAEEPMVPADPLLAELEEIHRTVTQGKRRK